MSGRPVYLIADDPHLRIRLGSRLSSLGFEAWPFAAGAQFCAMLDRLEPGSLVIAGEMVRPASLAPLEELAARGLLWPVVIVAAKSELRIALRAMKLGALDFVEEPVPAAQLEETLSLAQGLLEEAVLGESVRRDARERVGRLTPREMEVATALAEGLSNKLVAHRLGISVRTAEMHRARILRKLSLRGVAEIVPLLARAAAEPDGRLHLLAQRRLRGLSEARSAA